MSGIRVHYGIILSLTNSTTVENDRRYIFFCILKEIKVFFIFVFLLIFNFLTNLKLKMYELIFSRAAEGLRERDSELKNKRIKKDVSKNCGEVLTDLICDTKLTFNGIFFVTYSFKKSFVLRSES